MVPEALGDEVESDAFDSGLPLSSAGGLVSCKERLVAPFNLPAETVCSARSVQQIVATSRLITTIVAVVVCFCSGRSLIYIG